MGNPDRAPVYRWGLVQHGAGEPVLIAMLGRYLEGFTYWLDTQGLALTSMRVDEDEQDDQDDEGPPIAAYFVIRNPDQGGNGHEP